MNKALLIYAGIGLGLGFGAYAIFKRALETMEKGFETFGRQGSMGAARGRTAISNPGSYFQDERYPVDMDRFGFPTLATGTLYVGNKAGNVRSFPSYGFRARGLSERTGGVRWA